MKFCQKCGRELMDEAVICPACGCLVENNQPATVNAGNDGLTMAAKVFLIIGCIFQGLMLLPLAWCLPITISIFGKIKRNEPVGVGLKICALLLVNTIGGILLLCRQDHR